MTKLLVNPTIAGFSVDLGDNVISTKLDGGASRSRLDKIGSTHTVGAQWILEEQAYDYFMAFFRTEISYGSLPFTIDLKGVDQGDLATYTARFIGPPKSSMQGLLHVVSATLEITPADVNASADAALIAAGPGQ
jgi:hypothetical protein